MSRAVIILVNKMENTPRILSEWTPKHKCFFIESPSIQSSNFTVIKLYRKRDWGPSLNQTRLYRWEIQEFDELHSFLLDIENMIYQRDYSSEQSILICHNFIEETLSLTSRNPPSIFYSDKTLCKDTLSHSMIGKVKISAKSIRRTRFNGHTCYHVKYSIDQIMLQADSKDYATCML